MNPAVLRHGRVPKGAAFDDFERYDRSNPYILSGNGRQRGPMAEPTLIVSAQAKETPQISHALYYASLGWAVVPTNKVVRLPDGRAACTCKAGFVCPSKGKHPAVRWEQYEKERPSETQLREWFGGRFSGHGVGVITGEVSGIFVVDVDQGPGKQGGDTINDLQMIHGDLPHTVQAKTGGGGRHMIFRHPGGIWIETGKNVLGPGVDIRGDGGFIVTAPSLHESGLFYLWDELAHPHTTPIADAPGWLIEAIETPAPDATGKKQSPTGNGEIVRDVWGKVVDGRERHMVGIICGVIATHLRDCGLLPSVEEVVKEAWPAYERTTRPRGENLDDDGRGLPLMRQRAEHMLDRAWRGKWKVDPFTEGAGGARKEGKQDNRSNGTGGGTAGTDAGTPGTDTLPPILDATQFMATFSMPDYLIDGVIQRGRLHAMTSPTGHGKTAVALFLACMMASAKNIGAIEVTQGNVLFLAGENPDDLCVRLHAACQSYGIPPGDLPVYVMPGNFPISPEAAEALKAKIDATGIQFSLIIGDSLAAYFPGDDENHNVQMGNYARNWRVLTTCVGRPAVMALAHPIKAAGRDNLLPRGGGAFLAEIDANLTLWAEGDRETTTLHWQGKIRGADFQPITFGLTPVTLTDKADAKGRLLVSVVAALQTAEQADMAVKATVSNENAVLEWMRRYPGISIKDLAGNLGWVAPSGSPHKGKVHRILKSLQALKLVKFWRGKWLITDAGIAELKQDKIND